jgi:hypothetical protein
VAGLGISVFTDEMIDPLVAVILGNQGYDIESCHEAGRANLGLSDAEQLEYATREGRAILTFNTDDFRRLDRAYRAAGRRLAGIIVSGRVHELAELVRRVRLHLDTVRPEDQENRVLLLVR